jgi:hypothetical protein
MPPDPAKTVAAHAIAFRAYSPQPSKIALSLVVIALATFV